MLLNRVPGLPLIGGRWTTVNNIITPDQWFLCTSNLEIHDFTAFRMLLELNHQKLATLSTGLGRACLWKLFWTPCCSPLFWYWSSQGPKKRPITTQANCWEWDEEEDPRILFASRGNPASNWLVTHLPPLSMPLTVNITFILTHDRNNLTSSFPYTNPWLCVKQHKNTQSVLECLPEESICQTCILWKSLFRGKFAKSPRMRN